MKKKIKIIILLTIAIVFLLLINLFMIRAFSQTEIDDITPQIPCPELTKYKPDVLWIIPQYNETLISENQTWCQEILALNKTLGMHGIEHSYKEFQNNITQEKLDQAIQIWQACFKSKPTVFKPSQLALSDQNKKLLQENNFTIKRNPNQLIHKVYHCQDTGIFPNWFVKIF